MSDLPYQSRLRGQRVGLDGYRSFRWAVSELWDKDRKLKTATIRLYVDPNAAVVRNYLGFRTALAADAAIEEPSRLRKNSPRRLGPASKPSGPIRTRRVFPQPAWACGVHDREHPVAVSDPQESLCAKWPARLCPKDLKRRARCLEGGISPRPCPSENVQDRQGTLLDAQSAHHRKRYWALS